MSREELSCVKKGVKSRDRSRLNCNPKQGKGARAPPPLPPLPEVLGEDARCSNTQLTTVRKMGEIV